MIAGNTRLKAAQKLGMERVPVHWFDGSDIEAIAYAIADNRTSEFAEWDEEPLAKMLDELRSEDALDAVGFDEDEIAELLADLGDGTDGVGDGSGSEERDPPPLPENPTTRRGDVWILGRHRLICGDSTSERDMEALLADLVPDVICTDPPYCSGGFQEIGKSAGSVGTAATHKQIANDRLSTRGYVALLKSAINNARAPFLYAFTDWRMWVHLFDIAESSGFGVRSMIVWDKGTAGMGRGWRAQHELILWGARETPQYPDRYPGAGNLIAHTRTGNNLHTTEKPVALVADLLRNTPQATTVIDPFAGSGTTLIACERLGLTGYGIELDAAYCDVIVKRWQEEAEKPAQLETDGRTFDEIERERAGAVA